MGWFVESLASVPDPLDLRFEALISRMDHLLMVPAWQDDDHWVNEARRLFEETVTSVGLEDYDAFRAIASILANDLEQMRVRFEPQDYVVPTPYRDNNSYLWDFGDAEASPDEAIVLQQSHTPVQPTSEAAVDGVGGKVDDMELGCYSYLKWDRKLERLRPDWCTVIEKLPTWQGFSSLKEQTIINNARIPLLAQPRARHIDRAYRLRCQWEGEDIDLNAAIEVLIDRRLRLRPETRLFIRPGKGPRPSSVLVLLDLSASVADLGAAKISLLDIEKRAALLLATSNERSIDRLAIHGFSSNTRFEVYYYRLLEFGQALYHSSRAMISAVRGAYSTRMGTALRHAISHLRGEPEGQRSILVVTDGAPSDIDVHDAKYLIEDARQAVTQACEASVRTACIVVDGAADAYLHAAYFWLSKLSHCRRCAKPSYSARAHEFAPRRGSLLTMMSQIIRRLQRG